MGAETATAQQVPIPLSKLLSFSALLIDETVVSFRQSILSMVVKLRAMVQHVLARNVSDPTLQVFASSKITSLSCLTLGVSCMLKRAGISNGERGCAHRCLERTDEGQVRAGHLSVHIQSRCTNGILRLGAAGAAATGRRQPPMRHHVTV